MLTRIITSLVLLPPVLAAIWFAYPYFELLIVGAVVGLAWEWDKMASNKLTVFALINTALAVSAALMINSTLTAGLFLFATAVVCLVTYVWAVKYNEPYPFVKMFAPLYITLFAVSAVFFENTFGNVVIIWLMFIVFAADVGGMLVGCNLKGPKLCPTISPAKTWSGFIGGVVFAVLISWAFGYLFKIGQLETLTVSAVVISVIALFGDLLESKIKRVVGVKDSGSIIPGHGGIFDRLDSLMLVLIVVSFAALVLGKGVVI